MAAADAPVRAFVALEIGEAARAQCAQLIERMRPTLARITWVRSENFHLTLRFMGNVSRAQIDTVVARMRPEVSALPSFEAFLAGVGVFPHPRWPTVIWTALKTRHDDAQTLQQITERAAIAIGLDPETRSFEPHVTLGRVRKEREKGSVFTCLDRENPFRTDAFTVKAVSLFSSELTPQGARYTRLHRLTLDGLPRTRGV